MVAIRSGAFPLFASVLIVVAALAGCVGAEDPQLEPAGTAQPTASGNAGSIRGLVIDSELAPLGGVLVAMIEAGMETSTSTDGTFVFNGLDPGPKKVFLQKLGFESIGRTVDVRAGEITEVRFELKPILTVEPYSELVLHELYYEFGFSTPAVTVNPFTSNPTGNHKETARTEIGTDLEMSVSELTWESTSAVTGKEMRLVQSFEGSGQGQVQGLSPIRLEEGGFKNVEDGQTINHRVWVGFTSVTEPVVVVYDQRMTLFVSLFYFADAPDDYSALPE